MLADANSVAGNRGDDCRAEEQSEAGQSAGELQVDEHQEAVQSAGELQADEPQVAALREGERRADVLLAVGQLAVALLAGDSVECLWRAVLLVFRDGHSLPGVSNSPQVELALRWVV